MQKNNKIHQKMRERKREITFFFFFFFCVGKLCIEGENDLQIYSKMIGMRRAKNKSKINGQRKRDIKIDSSGDMIR